MARVKATYSGKVGVRHSITGGCDTDKSLIVAAVYQADEGHVETREFAQDQIGMTGLVAWFSACRCTLIVIESTANYHVLAYNSLKQAGLPIIVINPMVVKALLRVEGKSDKGDAITLAKLAASFNLKGSNMPDEMQREMRLEWKLLDAAKKRRTAISNSILARLAGEGCTLFQKVELSSVSGLRMLAALIKQAPRDQVVLLFPRPKKRPELEAAIPEKLPPYLLRWLALQYGELHQLDLDIQLYSENILKFREKFALENLIDLMCTAPLMNPMLALRLIADLGADFTLRYPTAGAFVKAIGIVPSNQVSGGKLLKRSTTHGSVSLKMHALSVSKAWALHPDVTRFPRLAAWFMVYRKRAGFMKSTSALTRKAFEGCYWTVKLNRPYDDTLNPQVPGGPAGAGPARHSGDFPEASQPSGMPGQ